MAFWDKTGDADGSTRGNYFPPTDGEFDVQIDAVKHKAHGHEGEAVIVEMRVLASNNPEVPAGTSKSTAWNITKHKDMAINNIKSFVCGIFGIKESDKTEPTKARVNLVAKRMVEADNPLCGVKVHLTTWGSKTRKGEDFTNMKWAPFNAEPDYAPPFPSATMGAFAPPPPPAPAAAPPLPPPPPPPSQYWPEGTSPGKGATHKMVNGAWAPL